ncbi:MmgE/PrpD family protein [Burkholderia pseudomultivorans]|uniref:MmgE/PrpD family protein n=1 Tax=Burkholderia pseudomultivorans TaxID=1207504 RepID=UPI0009BF39E9|nr:MmgE/PrpD family protein [Burkholderia pseudomultivorans]
MREAIVPSLATLALKLKSEVSLATNRKLIRQSLIDAIAAAVAGYDSPVASIAMKFARSGLGSGSVTPWLFEGETVTPAGAAFVNSSVMSALDIDDGNRAARGHLGAAIVPAASVFGATGNISAETFAHAVLAGCEIGARLGAAESRPFFASGRWAGVGAAIATAICLGFDRDQLANAIALAVHTAPLVAPAGARSAMTGHIKEGVPFGLLSGVTAALLAHEGYRGDPDAIESVGIYDIEQLANYPATTFAFKRTYFKRYTCCRLAHAPIDAALAIVKRERLLIQDIESVTVRTFRTAIELPNETRPVSFESAQYSLPFAIAVALLGGADALLPLSNDALADRHVASLAERIVLEHDPTLDAFYPLSTPTEVCVKTRNGSEFVEWRKTADGDPDQPFSDNQLIGKVRTLASGKISADRLATIITSIELGIPSAKDFETALRR